MSEGSSHNEMDNDSLKCNLGLYSTWMYTKWPALTEVCALGALLVITAFLLTRISMTHDIDMAFLSVCPSVRHAVGLCLNECARTLTFSQSGRASGPPF